MCRIILGAFLFLASCSAAWSESEQDQGFRSQVNSLVSELSPTLSDWQRVQLIQIFKLYETQSASSEAQVQTLSESLSRERKARDEALVTWCLGVGSVALATGLVLGLFIAR